jgi:hypothetical protein
MLAVGARGRAVHSLVSVPHVAARRRPGRPSRKGTRLAKPESGSFHQWRSDLGSARAHGAVVGPRSAGAPSAARTRQFVVSAPAADRVSQPHTPSCFVCHERALGCTSTHRRAARGAIGASSRPTFYRQDGRGADDPGSNLRSSYRTARRTRVGLDELVIAVPRCTCRRAHSTISYGHFCSMRAYLGSAPMLVRRLGRTGPGATGVDLVRRAARRVRRWTPVDTVLVAGRRRRSGARGVAPAARTGSRSGTSGAAVTGSEKLLRRRGGLPPASAPWVSFGSAWRSRVEVSGCW